MRKRSGLSVVVTAQIMALVACVPTTLAPTVVATPGPGKSAADFAADQAGCAAQANQQMAPAIQAANSQIVGNTLLGVMPNAAAQSPQSTQATLQQQYNVSYSACMHAKGDIVPGYAPVVAEPGTSQAKRVAKKKPTQQPAGSASVEPASAASATQSGSGFVEPAPAASATPAGASGGFVVPAASAPPAGATGGFVVPPPTRNETGDG
jgi:hypothetical protein